MLLYDFAVFLIWKEGLNLVVAASTLEKLAAASWVKLYKFACEFKS
jgi:hypothetical protein